MKPFDIFTFASYSWNPHKRTIELNYELSEKVKFTETLTLPDDERFPLWTDIDEEALDRALFALHLAGGASYYKTCCPKSIEIWSGTLSLEQAAFWDDLYENGLGEFFFKNDIDFRGLIQFPATNESVPPQLPDGSQKPKPKDQKRILVPIGGGKDSIVTLELLKAAGHNVTLFRMGGHPIIQKIAGVAGLPLLTVGRALSPTLFELNEQGALNGHVPITAYLSCLTIVLSILYGFDAVALSNELSANIGNVEFHGKEINHQWSKSLEFERAFQDYIRTFITPDVEYFSLLRPLSELSIVERFVEYSQYFDCTTSCNANWRILKDRPTEAWCKTCPKCAFVFALYAAFLDAKTATKIFGGNPYDDVSLVPLYRELLGLQGFKPFECVGTPEETTAAFLLAHRRGDLDETPVMQMFLSYVLPTIKNPEQLIADVLAPSDEHAIPPEFSAP